VPSKLNGLGISRPMLENEVRRRLLQIPNVRVREQCSALEPVSFGKPSRVTGIRVQNRASLDSETISADLVVTPPVVEHPAPGGSPNWGTVSRRRSKSR
jgi:hypothetical protein